MQTLHPSIAWVVAGIGLGALGLMLYIAQPLAVTMNGGVALCVEVDPTRIERRIKTRYLDRETDEKTSAVHFVRFEFP